MPEIKLGVITDPKIVPLFAAALKCRWCMTYYTKLKNGKPESIEVVLDVENESDAELLEAMRK